MRTWCAAVVAAVAVMPGATGCGGDPLSDRKHIAGWANSASALAVFTHLYEPLAFADGALAFADAACPQTSDDGTTVTIAGGGCDDSAGDTFHGSAIIERTAPGGREVTMTGYGHGRDGNAVARITGSATITEITELAERTHSFDVSLEVNGGLEMEIDYIGTVEGDYDGPTLWNGQGTIEREGPTIHSGTVDAVTVDQLRDNDVCAGESVSGRTTMVSDDHTVVITYDGGTDCDDDDAARWSRDGEDKGLLAGVVCAMAAPAARGRAPLGALGMIGAFALLSLVTARRRVRGAR